MPDDADSLQKATRPRVFIVSAGKSLKIARAIQAGLEQECEATVWDQGAFIVSSTILDDLERISRSIDFAIVVLGVDGVILSSGLQRAVARDNVVFEAGFFIAKLGQRRVIIVSPEGDFLHVPTDLAGITRAHYNPSRVKSDVFAAVSTCVLKISQAVSNIGRIESKRSEETPEGFADYVAAVCYRIGLSGPEVLLVNTTRDRKIFPKGRIRDDERPEKAVERIAHDEGGVFGRLRSKGAIQFRYFKEERSETHNIVAFFFEVDGEVSKIPSFRDPKWYSIDDALAAVRVGRFHYDHVNQICTVINMVNTFVVSTFSPKEQAAALPYRITDGAIEILLVTSRSNKRWIIPKGDVRLPETTALAAKREAREEAGVEGEISEEPIGVYEYFKGPQKCIVRVHSLSVGKINKKWDEGAFRLREWFTIEKAYMNIYDASLKKVIAAFSKYMDGMEKI